MEGTLTYIPLPKRPARPNSVTVAEREVLKTFRDALFGDFKVYKSATGRPGFWEDDPAKVQKLIDAFKGGHNIKNACFHAGISEKQWHYFNAMYPEFCQVKEACMSYTSFGAMNTVQTGLRERPELAFKYIEKRGDFNFDTRKVDEEKPLQPSISVGVQVNNNINNETAITERSRGGFARRVSERSGDGAQANAPRVAEGVQG